MKVSTWVPISGNSPLKNLPVSGNRMYYRQQTPNFVPPTHFQPGVVHEAFWKQIAGQRLLWDDPIRLLYWNSQHSKWLAQRVETGARSYHEPNWWTGWCKQSPSLEVGNRKSDSTQECFDLCTVSQDHQIHWWAWPETGNLSNHSQSQTAGSEQGLAPRQWRIPSASKGTQKEGNYLKENHAPSVES